MGIGMALKRDEAMEYKLHELELRDSKVYGGHEASPDCPQNAQGGFCRNYDKVGYQWALTEFGSGEFDMHPLKPSKLPLFGMPHEGTWSPRVKIQNV